jgi:hypothetical protein
VLIFILALLNYLLGNNKYTSALLSSIVVLGINIKYR